MFAAKSYHVSGQVLVYLYLFLFAAECMELSEFSASKVKDLYKGGPIQFSGLPNVKETIIKASQNNVTEVHGFNRTSLQHDTDIQHIANDNSYHKKLISIERLSKKLFPVVSALWKQTFGELPEKKTLEKGLSKILYVFWEPLLMLNKLAYISWMPLVAAGLSLVTQNSFFAGISFLMLIAIAFQKKALLAQAAGATSRHSIAPRQPKWASHSSEFLAKRQHRFLNIPTELPQHN